MDDEVKPLAGMDPLKRVHALPGNTLMLVAEFQGAKFYVNSRYQVEVRDAPVRGDAPAMWWLSIKRRGRDVIHDWRELQAIKNAVCGEECEGVELYPAESRKVDTSNQYHLMVYKDPTLRFPFGYTSREIWDEVAAAQVGAKQRRLKRG